MLGAVWVVGAVEVVWAVRARVVLEITVVGMLGGVWARGGPGTIGSL